MKKNLIYLLVFIFTVGSVFAASVNVRHTYVPNYQSSCVKDSVDGDCQPEKATNYDRHQTRVMVSHSFANNIGFSAELKWEHYGINNTASGDQNTDKYTGNYNEEFELGLTYQYKPFNDFTLDFGALLSLNTPDYTISGSAHRATYKYQVKGTYNITRNWNFGVRYRYADIQYARFDNKYSGAEWLTGEADSNINGDDNYHQINVTSYLRIRPWKMRFGVDYERKIYGDKFSSYNRYVDGENYDHLINFSADFEHWRDTFTPFVELGFISNASGNEGFTRMEDRERYRTYRDEFIPRYRVGVRIPF